MATSGLRLLLIKDVCSGILAPSLGFPLPSLVNKTLWPSGKESASAVQETQNTQA